MAPSNVIIPKLSDLFYLQNCLGQYERPIEIWKFRTMIPEANKNLEQILSSGLDSFGKPLNDTRITPFGKILRRYFLDELPQLGSLFKGDIKLVGIRPTPEKFWSIYPKEIKQRALQQKPGLMSINYAFAYVKDFSQKIKNMTQYLDEYEKDPSGTDKKYFYLISRNIIFRGVRSS